MSRHGYSQDGDCDDFSWIRWKGTITRAIRGKRGQDLLRRIVSALDAMPDKRLLASTFVEADGGCCTLGAVAKVEGIDLSDIDPDDCGDLGDSGTVHDLAKRFRVSTSLAREVMYVNDEHISTPEELVTDRGRWEHVDGRTLPYYDLQPLDENGALEAGWTRKPATIRTPTEAEIEASERRRWEYMRNWAASQIIEGQESTP